MDVLGVDLPDEEAQLAFAAGLAAALPFPCRLYLQGDLGTGKTTLVRGVLHALGYRGTVRSPTYTLVEPYRLRQGIFYHLDLYRLADPGELEYLGLRDMLAEPALIAIEWPERALHSLPDADLLLKLDHRDTGRHVLINAVSATGQQVLRAVQHCRHSPGE